MPLDERSPRWERWEIPGGKRTEDISLAVV